MAGLKLRAADTEDLAVISAILQDSLVTVAEMAYLPDEHRFVLVANRFKWEPQAAEPQGRRRAGERVLTGLCIDGVKTVSRRGFHPRESDRLLSLLAVRVAGEGPVTTLILDFAGGSSVRLEVERLLCHLDDLGEPWPARWRPKHPVADAG